jgi:hypothetical protein
MTRAEEQKGEERGGLGLFIGGGLLAKGARVWAYRDRTAGAVSNSARTPARGGRRLW